MYVVVVGGGKVGYYLVKTLVNKGHDVCLIEQSQETCQRFAEEFSILAINGNGTSRTYLEQANVGQAAVLAAVTGKDEVNLVVCQMAKRHFAVNRTIARVNNPKNSAVFQRLGVGVTVSSTSIISDLIENEVSVDDIRTLLPLHKGELVIVETQISEGAPAVNVAVADLQLPEDCVLISIIRDGHVIIPRGQTIVLENDEVVALASPSAKAKLRHILKGRQR